MDEQKARKAIDLLIKLWADQKGLIITKENITINDSYELVV